MARHHKAIVGRRWNVTRRRVFRRDGYRCRECGKPGRLECDHVIPVHQLPENADFYDLDNLQALCRGCHIAKTRRENEERYRRADPEGAKWKDAVNDLL